MCGIDERLARWAPLLLGDEGLTAARRLLARAVRLEPALLNRSDRDDVATGAVLWAVAKGNDLVGTNRPVRVGVIQDVCGLRSTPSGRGSSFAHAVGGDGSLHYGRPRWMFDAEPSVIPLGSPDLLVAPVPPAARRDARPGAPAASSNAGVVTGPSRARAASAPGSRARPRAPGAHGRPFAAPAA